MNIFQKRKQKALVVRLNRWDFARKVPEDVDADEKRMGRPWEAEPAACLADDGRSRGRRN